MSAYTAPNPLHISYFYSAIHSPSKRPSLKPFYQGCLAGSSLRPEKTQKHYQTMGEVHPEVERSRHFRATSIQRLSMATRDITPLIRSVPRFVFGLSGNDQNDFVERLRSTQQDAFIAFYQKQKGPSYPAGIVLINYGTEEASWLWVNNTHRGLAIGDRLLSFCMVHLACSFPTITTSIDMQIELRQSLRLFPSVIHEIDDTSVRLSHANEDMRSLKGTNVVSHSIASTPTGDTSAAPIPNANGDLPNSSSSTEAGKNSHGWG